MKKHITEIVIAIVMLSAFSVAGWYLYKHPEIAEEDDSRHGQRR